MECEREKEYKCIKMRTFGVYNVMIDSDSRFLALFSSVFSILVRDFSVKNCEKKDNKNGLDCRLYIHIEYVYHVSTFEVCTLCTHADTILTKSRLFNTLYRENEMGQRKIIILNNLLFFIFSCLLHTQKTHRDSNV